MNEQLFYYLNSFAGRAVWLDDLIIFFGTYLAYILVAVFLIVVIRDKNWKMLFISAASVFLSRLVVTELIRFFYFLPRPFVNNTIYQLISHDASGSFPSGHAAFFFALAMVIYFFHKKWGMVFFVCALLMGMARIVAGIHWPIDILGGAVIGIFSAWLVNKISKRYNF
ncbi:MAG: Bacitracin transport permease protein BCRC [Parcubacteria group bacterium Athens0714_26]|nr:MAG: Bacitracin transport permease protein BCRC [Parcubacteria group bacterium Athens0714_26]